MSRYPLYWYREEAIMKPNHAVAPNQSNDERGGCGKWKGKTTQHTLDGRVGDFSRHFGRVDVGVKMRGEGCIAATIATVTKLAFGYESEGTSRIELRLLGAAVVGRIQIVEFYTKSG